MSRDNKNDPPPSKGTDEPWKEPGQASQNPNEKQTKPDLDKWNDAVKKHGN
jgi:hypothetical protein